MMVNTGHRPSAQGRPLPTIVDESAPGLRISEAGRMILVQVVSPLDAENTPRMLSRLLPLIGSSRRVVLDLRRTEFVDSAGVRGLLGLQARSEQSGAELRLVTPAGSQIHKVFGLLQIDSRFAVFRSVIDAWITRWNDRRDLRQGRRLTA